MKKGIFEFVFKKSILNEKPKLICLKMAAKLLKKYQKEFLNCVEKKCFEKYVQKKIERIRSKKLFFDRILKLNFDDTLVVLNVFVKVYIFLAKF